MENLELLIDLHKRAARQGPGGEAETRKAILLAGLDPAAPLAIADIGCGTGASTMTLARELNARITAVDFLPEFVAELKAKAARQGLAERIRPLVGAMEDLPFAEAQFDVIWSEGAVYNMGFANGVNAWKGFLKPGGVLVVSEITWTTPQRPPEVQQYWEAEYPEIATAAAKIAVLENSGYAPIAYFVLPEYCWTANYYRPLKDSFGAFLQRNANSAEARAIVAAEEKEIALYGQYRQYYSYGVYIAARP